jgi:hypothetical protein
MLSSTTVTAILLCTPLAIGDRGGGCRPFSTREWDLLLGRVERSAYGSPADLSGRSPAELQAELRIRDDSARRIAALLDPERRERIDLALAWMACRGVWVAARGENGYPAAVAGRMGTAAPPVLFGAGGGAPLQRPAAALLADAPSPAAALDAARGAGRALAAAGGTLVSPLRSEAEHTAAVAALAGGGTVAAVPWGSLDQVMAERLLATAVAEDRLTLLSPFPPDSGWPEGDRPVHGALLRSLCRAVVLADGDWSATGEPAAGLAVFAAVAQPRPADEIAMRQRGIRTFDPEALVAALGLTTSAGGAGPRPARSSRRGRTLAARVLRDRRQSEQPRLL